MIEVKAVLTPASMRHVGVILREGFDFLVGDVAAHSASPYAPAWPHNLCHVGLFRLSGVGSSSRLASRPQCAYRAEPPHEPLEHLDMAVGDHDGHASARDGLAWRSR